MDNKNNTNLDAVINKVGFKVAEASNTDKSKYKNSLDKALGVLANDGVYAYYVYCKAKDISDVFIKEIAPLMEYTTTKPENSDYELYFRNLSENLHDLLFFKEILERALIYARYHAKAMGD